MQRLGTNSARVFVEPVATIQGFLSNNKNKWGEDLNGNNVTSSATFQAAVATLRSANGRNWSYPWANPFPYQALVTSIGSVSQAIYGSTESIIDSLRSIGIENILVAQHIGSSASAVSFSFSTLDPTTTTYWTEAWEVYQFSYAEAYWAWEKDISLIEYYNEPDVQLGATMNAQQYLQYYLIRALSIQNLYADMNAANPSNQVPVNVVASAFAKATYGGDPTQYLGDITVNNNNFMFPSSNGTVPGWQNFQTYSYHTYGASGNSMLNELQYLEANINNPSIPVIITEHNSKTSAMWNTLTTTADDITEAAQLSSQITNIILGGITMHFVFKFSACPSSNAGQEVSKNGLQFTP